MPENPAFFAAFRPNHTRLFASGGDSYNTFAVAREKLARWTARKFCGGKLLVEANSR
jgi:hypothetical protein